MKLELFDYQREAAVGCLQALWAARANLAMDYRSAFALSAVTGAGKTVIATAVIEAMFHGSADLGAEADPRACFLWVTDDPALNNQTRNKMLAASDMLAVNQLYTIDNDFQDSQLSPGRVYFLNIQKLSKNSGLAQSGTNKRQFSMWDILANTINDERVDLYLVLDEAHKGMKSARDRKTIVKRMIDGQAGQNPPVPVVWGISATIERFTDAMSGLDTRMTIPVVEVDIDAVRASGLVKDEIGIDQPDESGTFSTTLLREAVKATLDYEQRWATYAEEEHEPLVLPVMVIQVPDKASDAKLTEMLSVIESEWPDLGPDAVAHVFGEHETIVLPSRAVRWVPPETIQSDTDIRIVLAKTAISTGWDCPRAEVMYSERPAKDATHIAQVIGRMVRQPLARRIPTDDALNSVSCYLPNFNRTALEKIKAELEGNGESGDDGRVGPSVSFNKATFERNALVPAEVFDFVESLPSIPTPDVLASPLRRARKLAQLLCDDASGSALVADAGEQLTDRLNARLRGLAAEHEEQVEANVEDLERMDVARDKFDAQGQSVSRETRQIATHLADLDRDTTKVIRSVKEGAGQDFYRYCVDNTDDETDTLTIKTEVAALLKVDGVIGAVDATATAWVREQLEEHDVAISLTTGARRDGFTLVREMTSEPETAGIDLRDNLTTATATKDGPLPTFEKHLYADGDGLFPARLNAWETEVIQTEIARETTVAWYRNPSRATTAAMRIAYQKDDGRWTSLQPDFVIISRLDDGTLISSIVDPHGDHLADAKNKLKALARHAEQFGERFAAIKSLTKASDGTLRSLDLLDPNVRAMLEDFDGAEVGGLYESDHSLPYR
ncbi:MAG: DEAD/DEAH box helicase family protein [Actinomycetota bacterium]